MRLLSILVLGIGLALAGGGVYYVNELTRPNINNIQSDISILVAKRPLLMNERIKPGDLAFQDYPPHLIPSGAFTSVDELLGNDFRYARTTIYPGDPVVVVKLYDRGEKPGFGLPDGWRAMTIGVDARDIIAGFVKPGDHLDLFHVHKQDGKLTSAPLLHGVEVLAVGQNTNRETSGPQLGSTLTFRVRIEDAQRIDLARRTGDISVALMGESGGGGGKPLDEDDLRGVAPKAKEDERFIWKSDGEGNKVKVPIR